jgi:hypothetical protein
MAVGIKAHLLLHPASPFGPVPGAEDLDAIQRLTRVPVPSEALYVRRMLLANTWLGRTYERFPPAVLARCAGALPPVVCRRSLALRCYCQGCRITLPQLPVIWSSNASCARDSGKVRVISRSSRAPEARMTRMSWGVSAKL